MRGLDQFAADDRPKTHFGGSHRIKTPAQTLDVLRGSFQQMGITRVNLITGLDQLSMPVAQAVRPMARNLSVSQGKGRTQDEALTSAAMEAAESWHAERVGVWARATAGQMRDKGGVVDPAEMAATPAVPGQFDDVMMGWVRGVNLITNETVFVPQDCVAMDYTVPPDSPMIARSSNGLAAGNTRPEALVSALCEVIERDAMARFCALSGVAQEQHRVRRSDVANSGIQAEVADFEAAGLSLSVWDITGPTGIPAFYATLGDGPEARSAYRLPPASGSGCYLDSDVALSRAVSEAVQSRLTLISGSRDDLIADDYDFDASVHNASITAAILSDPFACNLRQDQCAGASALEDLTILVAALMKTGLSCCAVCDLSVPGIGISVMRVVTPGLAVVAGHQSYGPIPVRAHV